MSKPDTDPESASDSVISSTSPSPASDQRPRVEPGVVMVSSRMFPVRRERLFDAFMDPEKLARWWGPDGFTNEIEVFDPEPGGTWRMTMIGPNGARYENESEFVEVVEPERIVFDHLRTMHVFRMTMVFEAVDGGGDEGEGESTRLTWTMEFDRKDDEQHEKLKDFIAKANEENFDRLGEVVMGRA